MWEDGPGVCVYGGVKVCVASNESFQVYVKWQHEM